MLRTKNYNLLVLPLFVVAIVPRALADHNVEHSLKVGFVYNFTKFVDWPEERTSDPNKPIIIGVIGPKSLFEAFEPIENKQAKNKSIVVKHFVGFEKPEESQKKNDAQWNAKIETLKKCHVLVHSNRHWDRKVDLARILDALKDSAVLTIGERVDFLEKGGIINFLMEDKKVRFEINNAAAKQAKLKIRSQLLRLAKRVIPEKPSDEAKN